MIKFYIIFLLSWQVFAQTSGTSVPPMVTTSSFIGTILIKWDKFIIDLQLKENKCKGNPLKEVPLLKMKEYIFKKNFEAILYVQTKVNTQFIEHGPCLDCSQKAFLKCVYSDSLHKTAKELINDPSVKIYLSFLPGSDKASIDLFLYLLENDLQKLEDE